MCWTLLLLIMLSNGVEKNPGPLSIGHQNARSIANRTHFLQLKMELTNLQYDVYGISESWLHDKIESKDINIDGYQIYRQDRAATKIGGGVAVYVSNKFKVKVMPDLCQSKEGIEQLWVKIKQKEKAAMMIGVIYIPPQIAKKKDCLEKIYPMIATSLAMTTSLCMMGDFNLDYKEMPDQVKHMLTQFNLKQVIESPTHFGQKTQSILDHIYVAKSERVITSSALPGISDHYATTITIDMESPKQQTRTISFRSMRNFTQDQYTNDLIDEPWQHIFENDCPHEKARMLSDYMISAMDKNCPIVRRKLKSRHAMWFSDDIRQAKSQKFSWLRQYNASGHFIAKIMYKHYERKERSLLRKAEKVYYNNLLEQCANDPRNTWKLLNEILPRKDKVQTNQPNETQFKDLCEKYNDHFIKVGPNAASNAAKTAQTIDTSRYKEILSTRPKDGHCFDTNEVSEREVKTIIMNMPDNKAAGTDDIKPTHLKKSLDVTLPVITNVMNSCIRHSIMPESWKVAKVRPIRKIKNNTDPNNQRPIALLPILSKVLERLIYNQFSSYLEKHGRMSTFQNGSRKRNSTETTLLSITNTIHKEIDKGNVTAMISFDCSKAFDSISHPRLLKRLENLGMSNKAYNWFKNYLSDRKQYTAIETARSSTKDIEYGVPQGSIFGGLLFCLYVDPILEQVQMHKEMYVDDLTIFHAFNAKQAKAAEKTINEQCNEILAWYSGNDLQLNPSKTKMMLFGQPKTVESVKQTIQIKIDGSVLNASTNLKLLGVVLDQKLTYKDHVEQITKKCAKLLYRVHRVRSLLTKETAEKLIKTAVVSRLLYCASLLTTANKESIHQMQSLQNYAIKTITQNYLCTNLSPIYRELKWLRIENMIEERLAISVYKSIKKIHPKKLQDLFTQRKEHTTTRMNLRNQRSMNIPTQASKTSSNRYEVKGAKLWNEYGNAMNASCPTLPKFKRALRKHLFTQQQQ